MRMIANIFWLGTKELRSFLHDFVLLGFVIYAFSIAIISHAQSYSQELHNASIAFVDEDHSELSRRIAHAFLPPYFKPPQYIAEREIVPFMNARKYTFVVDIPPNFQRDVLGARRPIVQVNVDATVMVQAGIGSGYAQQIIMTEIQDFLSRAEGVHLSPVKSRRPHRVQSECHNSMVYDGYGSHQQRHHVGHYSRRRRRGPRARTRHYGSSPRHAIDAVRNSDV